MLVQYWEQGGKAFPEQRFERNGDAHRGNGELFADEQASVLLSFPHDDIWACALCMLEERWERGLGTRAGEDPPHDESIAFGRRYVTHLLPEWAQASITRMTNRYERRARLTDTRLEVWGRSHVHVASARQTRLDQRDQRLKVSNVADRGEENAHP
jgi:hypothetical protein